MWHGFWFQFDGVHVVSGSLDTSIRVWEVETGACRHTLMGHQSLTSGMELRNNILVSGNADSTVKVWDIVSGQCLQTLSGKETPDRDGRILGSSSLKLGFVLYRTEQTPVGGDVLAV